MINNIITKKRIKTLLILVFSFAAITWLSPQIFLVDSPRINPLFIARLQNTPFMISQLPGRMMAGLTQLNPFKKKGEFANVKIVTPPADVIFKPITKGVSAAEDPKTGQTYIQIQGGTKYVIDGYVTINGQKIPKIVFVE